MKIISVLFLVIGLAPATFGQVIGTNAPNPFALQELVPTLVIYPADVVQKSIHQWRLGTNNFGVHWTFTEAGASKMLAFHEAHVNQKTRIAMGDYVSPPRTDGTDPARYQEWKQGWLKYRTDKIFGVTEAEAQAIVEGLTKPPQL